MINTKSKFKEIKEIVSKTCDVCKKTFDKDDYIEFNSFIHIQETCGYGSIFGDGSVIELDVCQLCCSAILGEYIKIEEDDIFVIEEDNKKVNNIVCYVDGACSGNPGPGGIGIVILDGDIKEEISENIGRVTNNIAELYAIKRCLEEIHCDDRNIKIYTDSQYAIGVLTMNWSITANIELIHDIKSIMSFFKNIEFIKISGHTGDINNERANKLAQQASKEG